MSAMTAVMVDVLSGAYLFGSAARGDADASSDIDVLLTYRIEPTAVQRRDAQAMAEALVGGKCSFAEYSDRRIAELFELGHLFAWHIFQEARPIDLTTSHVEPLSRPKPYRDGLTDATQFQRLLISTINELRNGSESLIYESGIAYLALRNIGMSLSYQVSSSVDFTRWAPFGLSRMMRMDDPCSLNTYEKLIAARHASQRGTRPPSIQACSLLNELLQAERWAAQVIERVSANANT
jgi:predicted nucleotidyltransferase